MNSKPHVTFASTNRAQFFQTLRLRVDGYFKDRGISKHANAAMVIKTIVLLISYILPFALMIALKPPLWVAFILWFVMGTGLAGIGMSVMHDANHEAYSKKKWVNYLIGHSLSLLGCSVFNWKLQHNVLHHTYTNIQDMDEDIDNKFLLRFSPHAPRKAYHRFQWIYAFFLYGFLSLYWVTIKDFVQFYRYAKIGVNRQAIWKNYLSMGKIILMKATYFFVFLVAPSVFWGFAFWQIIIGFVIMHFTAGLILSVVFQLAHSVESASHPVPKDGLIENDWAIHQIFTTVNFSRSSKWLTWYLGGLNFQKEHHLFPRISHIHYPRLAEIVKKTCAEFRLPYLEYESFKAALGSHVRLLKRLGQSN